MNKDEFTLLTNTAKAFMAKSHDKIHDLAHVERVVNYAEDLSREKNLKAYQKNALILAAWWHDVGRTVTKKPSLVLMTFLDDIISGMILLQSAWSFGIFNKTLFLGIRLLLCHSLGTGTFFTRVLLHRENKELLNILKDADVLDGLRLDRIEDILPLVEQSKMYYLGYKTMAQWWLRQNQLKMKTLEARKYVEQFLIKMVAWAMQPSIREWHIKTFGSRWSSKMMNKLHNTLDEIVLLNLQTA